MSPYLQRTYSHSLANTFMFNKLCTWSCILCALSFHVKILLKSNQVPQVLLQKLSHTKHYIFLQHDTAGRNSMDPTKGKKLFNFNRLKFHFICLECFWLCLINKCQNKIRHNRFRYSAIDRFYASKCAIIRWWILTKAIANAGNSDSSKTLC